MTSKLALYILNSDNSVAPFPSEAEQIVLYDFTFEAQRMGAAPEITATIQANGSLENYITTKVFCEYNGERYFLKNLPSSSKENTDSRYTFDLTFVSERRILDNVYMIDAVQGNSNVDRYQSNSTNIVFMGTIEELVGRLNAAMTYAGVGYSVVLDKGITTESKLVSFQDKFFTEALQEGVNVFNIPYYYVGKVIHFGWAEKEVPQTLKYAKGLVSISKNNTNSRIVTRATATGSSDNLPYYYPNPTPLGTISPVASASNNGITNDNIALVNPYKFSKLQSNTLQYFTSKASASVINYAVADMPEPEGNIIAAPYTEQCEIPHEDYKMAGALVHLSAKDYIDRTVYVEFNHGKISGDAPINEVRPIEYGVYKFTELDGQKVLTEDRTVNVVFESSALGDFVVIENFPADQERYVMATYYNSSSWDVVIEFACHSSLSNDELKTSWYVVSPSGERIETAYNPSDYGLSISGTPSEGDVISVKVESKIPFATSLMPSIYRNSSGDQRFYNASNGAYEDVVFDNEYDSANPLEAITKFEDIKPTIVGTVNANGERIDVFAEFAYDLYDDDSTITDSEGNEEYVHPYFYAKLHKTNDVEGGNKGFNLFAQAIETGEMTIEMTSGVCGACKFTIMVDSNTQRNLVMVDGNGNLIYDDATGKVKMADDATGIDRQNDTENYEVWVALKKDINTYGQIMPNVSYSHYPSITDTFVITNIILPNSYIENAEKRLEVAIIDFIIANNKYKFDYDVNISRIYLKKNIDVYNTISENSIIQIEYNGDVKSFYITAFTYRKEKNAVLPDISITLSDSIESSPNSFSQTISAVKIDTQKYVNSQPYISDLSKMFLRKDMQDTANAPITFKKQLVFGESILSEGFKSGSVNGYGLGLYKDANGLYTIEVDRVLTRRGIVGNGSGNTTPSKNIVTTNTDQVIEGVKTFANGFKIGNTENAPHVRYDADKNILFLPFNVMIERGLAWNSRLENFTDEEIFTITKAVNVDGKTIKKDPETGALYAVSSGTGGGFDETQLADYLTKNKYVTESALQSYAKTTDLDKYLLRTGGKITGELQITKGEGVFSGGYLYFGDRGYVYITEDTEDHLSIYADRGIDLSTGDNYSVKVNGSAVVTEKYVSSALADYLSLSGGTISGDIQIQGSTIMYSRPTINTTEKSNILFQINGKTMGAVGYTTGNGSVSLWNETAQTIFQLLNNGTASLSCSLSAPKFIGEIQGAAASIKGSGFGYPGYDANTASATTIVRYTYGNNAPRYGALLDVSIGQYGFQLNTESNSDSPLYYRRHAHPDEGGFGSWQQLARITESSLSPTGGTLTVNGNILATGVVAWNSSRILKNIIGERYLTLDEMLQMKPYAYTWKDGRDNLIHAGAVADEVKPILPEAVITDDNNIHSMDYAQTAYVMCASLARELAIAKEEFRQLKGVA